MKTVFINLFIVCFFSIMLTTNVQSQCTTNHSTHPADQRVQGPCFAFATVAAIEALSSTPADLSEWYLYSKCSMQAVTDNGPQVITRITNHFNNVGGLYQDDFYDPFAAGSPGCLSGQGNPNPGGATCLFICDGAAEDFCNETSPEGCPMSLFLTQDVVDCSFGGFGFQRLPPPSNSFLEGDITLTSLNFESIVDPAVKNQILSNELCSGQGVVIFVEDYTPNSDDEAPLHAIFAYKMFGNNTLVYKDSWPGDPDAARSLPISRDKMKYAYKISGNVFHTSCFTTPPPPGCNCELVGPSNATGSATFTLEGYCPGNKAWDVSDNLDIISGGGKKNKSITVALDSCAIDTAMITVEIDACPLMSATFILDPFPAAPTGIEVYAQDVCPDQLVELNVVDENGTFPNTTYQWQIIQGGNIQSGQGTPVIFAQTSNTFGPMIVRVVAVNECGVSDPFFLSIPFSENCDGKGEGDIRSSGKSILDVQVYPNPANDYLYISTNETVVSSTIYSIHGLKMIETNKKEIETSFLNPGLYLITIRSADSKEKTIKLIIQ